MEAEVINALSIIPSDDRDLWVKMAMAIKSEGLDFEIFNDWSANAHNYSLNDAKSVWRSANGEGGITIASLFYEAKNNGYIPNSYIEPKAQKPRPITDEVEKFKRQRRAAIRAETILDACTLATFDHPFLVRKRITPRLKPWLCGNRLIIPVMDITGNVHSLQSIAPSGKKKFLPAGKIKSHFYQLSTGSDNIIICEGYATAVTLYTQYTPNSSVYVAFGAGNILPVAKVLREAFPDREIIIAGDDDEVGRKKAKEAAEVINGTYSIPKFQEDEQGSDFNDRWCLDNPEDDR